MNKDLTVGDPQKVLWRFCLPLFGSKHQVVMIEQLRMAIMSEQALRERQQRRK